MLAERKHDTTGGVKLHYVQHKLVDRADSIQSTHGLESDKKKKYRNKREKNR
jgi:hypothetical protein